MPTFGERLKELREEKGHSQASLANVLSVSVWTIRNHEQNRRGISSEDLFTYCKTLGVPCSAFEGCTSKNNGDVQKRVAIVKQKKRHGK